MCVLDYFLYATPKSAIDSRGKETKEFSPSEISKSVGNILQNKNYVYNEWVVMVYLDSDLF